MDKNFNAKTIEEKCIKEWLGNSIFTAGKKENLNKKPYVIMMPPPNVTGTLHNGHALFVTLQDILARFHRMKGFDVLWLPGTDHAGIATQSVVERQLKKEGKSRHDLGRKEFLKRVFEWKDLYGNRIIEQLKLLGASADWSRLCFTMDERCSKAVRTAFVKLWEEGLIYRSERLISYDPKTKTALSNEEVSHEEREGELFYFNYQLKEDKNKFITVATTRPETMLGDVAVAVNPKDERFLDLIGKELIHPFFKSRQIKVIADDYVDISFGSGAVKITPAHDPNDFLIGKRHNLPFLNIFTQDALINKEGGEFIGLDRYEARKKIKERLMSLGLFVKSEKIRHQVAISQRSHEEIEPMLSRQYFVNTRLMAKKALDAVKMGEVRIFPDYFVKTYEHFLSNIEDWCISRQLWWGHQIPIFYHIPSMKDIIDKNKNLECYKLLVNNNQAEEILKLALNELSEEDIKSFSFAFIENPENLKDYIQEEDVLDTWFSSGLWPFSTLGWPENTDDLKRYYPGDVLETGFDILFFWVARMMMFGIHFMGKAPFKDIYLHPMVRDAHGRKMSKSLGNAIDPVDVMNGISLEDLENKIKTYPVPKELLPKVLAGLKKEYPEGIPQIGADGLRLSLAIFSGQGSDVRFNIPRVLGYRAFLNKLWNATRFLLMNIEKDILLNIDKDIKDKLSLPDRYILSSLNKTIKEVNKLLENYGFSEAAEKMYHFFWQEFCDIYIECAKVSLKSDILEKQQITKSVLVYLLDESMRLIHPFCPFISEEIWQNLPIKRESSFCATSPYPEFREDFIDERSQKDFSLINEVCILIRNARQTSNISASLPVPVKIFAQDEDGKKLFLDNKELIAHLAKTKSIDIGLRGQEMNDICVLNSGAKADIAIFLHGLIDIDKEKERISQNLKKLSKEISSIEERLKNKDFINNAPKDIIKNFEMNLKSLQEKKSHLKEHEKRLAIMTK